MNWQLLRATALGTAAQVGMVLAGHVQPAVAAWFAVGGMGISAVAGWAALRGRRFALAAAAGQGGLAGGVCAAIGIAVSVALADVPATLLLLGTAGSTVAGAAGGLIGGWFGRRR